MNLREQFEKATGRPWQFENDTLRDEVELDYVIWLEDKYHTLLIAAKDTIEENLHLCDGEDCTLKKLRDAVSNHSPK